MRFFVGLALSLFIPVFATAQPAAEVRITSTESGPSVPPRGTVAAYRITSTSQMVAGHLADAFYGDLVLENDAVRVVVGRIDKPLHHLGGGGNILDVVHRKSPADYINYLLATGDLDGTASEIIYTEADEPRVVDRTTATVVVKGSTGMRADPDTKNSQPVLSDIAVVTTYSLPKNENYLLITTSFQNNSSSTVSLLPGDVIDWGTAGAFIPGKGGVRDMTTETVPFVLGAADEFSMGYINAGTGSLHGAHTSRVSLLRGYGSGPLASMAPKPKAPTASEMPKQAAPASAETSYQPALPVPSPPAVETVYRNSLIQPESSTTTSLNITAGHNAVGGAEETSTQNTAATASKKDGSQDRSSHRLSLAPGQTYTYSRYLVVSDRDFSRVSNFAWKIKRIETGAAAGAVVESRTEAFLPNTEVLISGGGKWNGDGPAPAFVKTVTSSDGTFALRLPFGKYVLSPMKNGRVPAAAPTPVDIVPHAKTQLTILTLSPESVVRLGVSEAETATSVPLPSKVTFIPKPGSAPIDFGFGTDVVRGERNVFFMPRGGASIPVTPGRYQINISRGLEYEALTGDLTVPPASEQEILQSMPHSFRGQTSGLVSFDVGVMTTASSTSLNSPRDVVIMAACEGVPIIISGDYETATDLQPEINALGLRNRLRAFVGMRFLVEKNGLAADVLVYPIPRHNIHKIYEFRARAAGSPPDIFLADMRREFPELIIQIENALDPERGYLSRFDFDETSQKFTSDFPPPDFDVLQLIPGKKVGLRQSMFSRYYQLLRRRLNDPAGATPLAGLGNSSSRLPHGEEVGYPRVFIRTSKPSFQQVTEEDIVHAIRGQHYMVTNGPLPQIRALNPATDRFDRREGDVVDVSTTDSARIALKVIAAPWVAMNAIHVNALGRAIDRTEVRPTREVVRYPLVDDEVGGVRVHWPTGDSFVDFQVFSGRRTLDPVVPANPIDLGGPVHSFGWTAPIFVDRNGDGFVRPPADDTATTSPETQ